MSRAKKQWIQDRKAEHIPADKLAKAMSAKSRSLRKRALLAETLKSFYGQR